MNSATDIWLGIIPMIREKHNLSDMTIKTWFQDTVATAFADNKLVVVAPSTFIRDVVKERYADMVSDALLHLFSAPIEFVICTEEDIENDPQFHAGYAKVMDDDEYSFERFVVGDSNRMAFAASKAVAEGKGGKSYNPLYIYGGSGLGKTHLLHAIERRFKNFNKNATTLYVTLEAFLNDFVESLRSGEGYMTEFRKKYRGVDLLLIDDIQFVGGKDRFQEELFHTFNALFDNGKQIVFTSDRVPGDIPKLEDRLKTRLAWGVSADVYPPDLETRIAIIKTKAQRLSVPLSDEQVLMIAENVTSNVRQLEGAVKKVLAHQDLMSNTITNEVVRVVISDLFEELPKITPELILTKCAGFYSCDLSQITGKLKIANVVKARQMAIFLMRELLELSYPAIGEQIGKDHSTVMHNFRKVEGLLKNDVDIKKDFKEIRNSIIGNN